MENYVSQQTGCKVFRICARSQLDDQEFLQQVQKGITIITTSLHLFSWCHDLTGEPDFRSLRVANSALEYFTCGVTSR